MPANSAEYQRNYRFLRKNARKEEICMLLKMQAEIENLRKKVAFLTEEIVSLRKDSGSSDGSLRKGSSLDSPPKESPSLTLPKEDSANEGLLPFDAFWKAYPRKIGKQAARRQFARAIKLTDSPTILAAIGRYKEHKPPDLDFCHPATWLHQGRWDDDFSEPPGSKANGNGRQRELSAVGKLYLGAAGAAEEVFRREFERKRREQNERDRRSGSGTPRTLLDGQR